MSTTTQGSSPEAGGGLPLPKSKGGLKGFYNEVVREMKKVTWPTRSETNRLTGVVLAVTILCVTVLTVLGLLFGTIIDLLTKGTV